MKRYAWTALFAILAALCAAKLVPLWGEFMKPPDATFVGPATFVFKVPETGDYTLWHQFSGMVDGSFQSRDKELPFGSAVTVQKGTSVIPVSTMKMTVTIGSEGRTSLFAFKGEQDDELTISATGFTERRGFQITHAPILRPILTFIAWCAGAIGMAVLTLLFLILALTGVFPKKKRPAT